MPTWRAPARRQTVRPLQDDHHHSRPAPHRHPQRGAGQRAGGLLRHGTYHRLANLGVDECNLWGDYYYLEALARLQRGWASYDRLP